MRLQCKFLASFNPYKYELFDVISEAHLNTVISSHISSGNVVIELYVKFVDANRFGPSLTTIEMNTGCAKIQVSFQMSKALNQIRDFKNFTICFRIHLSHSLSKAELQSLTTQFDYYDVPETSIGRYSSVFGINLNFRSQFQSGRINDLLISTRANDGMSNTVLECDNKSAYEKRDANKEKGAANANERDESEPEPIRQRDLDSLEVALFFEPDLITMGPEPLLV
ncbi:hypothetical protein J1N35_043230 [Gossypium stocksii]|uniref:Uncharacterized protein n=1 Tax=Gossypium stocksii TaxID=47602 RepID=A0A9D3ZEW9_9ROSI|nr:hypothetical protein J1N35_043230 [Gossypium stocksii]